LRPLRANTLLATLPKPGTIQSIHRFGQELATDANYWFHWSADTDVVRGLIFGDTQERTYFTSPALAAPQVTDLALATTGGTNYPVASYDLGIPTPTATPTLTVNGVADSYVSSITLGTPGSGYAAAPSVQLTAPGMVGQLSAIDVINGGSGYTVAPTVTVSAPPSGGTLATATAIVTNGAVTSITITSAGAGYTTEPTITLTGVGTGAAATAKVLVGRQATATATLNTSGVTTLTLGVGGSGYTSAPTVTVNAPGLISGLTINNGGTGYTAAPTVTISAPPAGGTTATATAQVYNGAVIGLTITNPGSGYLAAPTVAFTGVGSGAAATAIIGGGSGAAAYATVSGGAVTGVTLLYGGYGYTTAPTVTITGGGGTGATATTTVAANAGTVKSLTIVDGGVGYSIAPTVTITGGGGTGATGTTNLGTSAIAETRVYVVTYVSAWGEESSASPASASTDVYVGQSVTVALPTLPTGAFSIVGYRIYRSAAGTGSTNYLFVGEALSSATTFVDTRLAADLGELLPSLGHEPPPAGMIGLTAMPNGVMAGFVGRDLYFSEPYKPHAWPVAYSMTTDSLIVGLGVFGSTLLVLTQTYPYLVSGSNPLNFTMIKADIAQACVSKRSIVDTDGGTIYASPDGLFLVNGGGFRNLTEQLFTRIEWQALNPSTMQGFTVGNRYLGFYGGTSGFMLDFTTGDFMPLNWYASAGYYDAKFDNLYLVTNNNQLVTFDTGANLTMTWRSKPFYSAKPVNLGFARVEAGAYPVTANIYADGVLKHAQTVADSYPFRLPGGFMANTWSLEVVGASDVTSIGFAESMQELQHG